MQRRLLNLAPLGLIAFFMACPPPGDGCQFLNDCPQGQQCRDRVCVDIGPITPPITPPGPDNDAGPDNPGDVVAVVNDGELNSTQTIPWIQTDPRDPSRVVFPEYQAGNFDLLRVFDKATGDIDDGAEINFNDNFNGCNLDSFTVQAISGRSETWFNCNLGAALRITYDDNLNDVFNVNVSTQLVYETAGLNGNFPRRLVVERGGSTLTSWEVTDADGEQTLRNEDTFDAAIAFGEIVSLHGIAESTIDGDHVLVFDAGAAQLYPMTLNSQVWEPAASVLPYTIPGGAAAIVLLSPLQANGQTLTPNQANVAAIYPSEGRIRFFNFEEQVEIDDPGTLYEPTAAIRGTVDTSERLLLEVTPGGDAIFWTNQASRRLWRIPLRANADADVRSYDFVPNARRASGISIVDDDEVWVSYGTDPSGPAIERFVVNEIP